MSMLPLIGLLIAPRPYWPTEPARCESIALAGMAATGACHNASHWPAGLIHWGGWACGSRVIAGRALFLCFKERPAFPWDPKWTF